MRDLFTIRPPSNDPADREVNFVVSAWLKSFKRSKHAGVLPNNKYMAYYKEVIDQLLARGMKILVIANKTNNTQLLGFIAYEQTAHAQTVVHYIYVKDVLWNQGVGTLLLRSASVTRGVPYFYTFRTYHSRYLTDGYHNPGLARRKNLEPVYEVPAEVRRIQHRNPVLQASSNASVEPSTRS